MNMALRPFSLLLLLLVMIPAMAKLELTNKAFKYDDMHCDRPTWFCFKYTSKTAYKATPYHETSGYDWTNGGIAIDTTKANEWIVYFDWWFDKHYPTEPDKCTNSIVSTAHSEEIQCRSMSETSSISLERNGITIVPIHHDYGWYEIDYKLEMNAGSYLADKFQLYADPELKLKFYLGHSNGKDHWRAETPGFKPYECNVQKTGQKPDDSAVEANRAVSTFSCGSGYNIFLDGTNTYTTTVYCGGEGWFDMERKMILKQLHSEKKHPYCLKDVMFEDCTNNKCFVFRYALDQPQSDDLFVKVDDPTKIKDKLGAYLVFETDNKWKLHVAYLSNRDADLTSITIGKKSFAITPYPFGITTESNVDMKIERSGPKLITGFHGFVFELAAKTNEPEKDLMVLFGFYKGEENKIKLVVDGQDYEAAGVANFGNYVKNSQINFPRADAEPQGKPDVHNIFTCKNGKTIYLDTERTGLTEIRYTTKKGWLKRDGTPVPSGNSIVAGVYCFTVCQKDTVTLPTDPKDQPNKDATKMEYKCNGGLVKVDSKFYASVSCENDQWKGDGNNFAVPGPKFAFGAECYGAFKYVKVCTKAEADIGCGEIKMEGVGVSCEDGFLLTLAGHDEKNIRKSLQVNKDDHWFDGTQDIGKTAATDRPLCYSKCAPKYVVGSAAVAAKYAYKVADKAGTLSCDQTEVLVMTLDGKKRSFVKDVTCDKEGWKIGTEKVAERQSGAVNAECIKSCAPDRLAAEVCTTGWDTKRDCGVGLRSFSAMRLLSCPDTHALFVNDKQMSTALECTRAGWMKKETTPSPDAMIIDHTINYNTPIKAECFARCGKKLVTYSAAIVPTRTNSQLDLKCNDNTHMISYVLNGAKEESTLEDLKCEDKKGWMAGTTEIIAFSAETAAAMNVECKQSCNEGLVKDDCTGRAHCLKASFKNNEWSCNPSHVLWSSDKHKASPEPIKCEKLQLMSDKVTIARTSPTSQATISCYPICDDTFFPIDDKIIQKSNEKSGGFAMKCKSELHHLEISYSLPSPFSEYSSEFKCSNDQTGRDSITTDRVGQPATISCRNKCENRIKEDSCSASDPDCVKPILDGLTNKLTCDNAHVMRIKKDENSPVQYVFGNELECKKDGFYENTENVLSFHDDPKEDVKLKFGISCISTCDSELVLTESGKPPTEDSNPGRFEKIDASTQEKMDVLQCQFVVGGTKTLAKDQILHVTYGAATVRVFGEATCVKDSGWTGVHVKSEGAADNQIVKFADHKALSKAKCVNVCDGAMVKDGGLEQDAAGNLKHAKHFEAIQHNSQTLQCKDHYRLFINNKNNDGNSVAAAKMMTCSNAGWMEGTEKIIDFKDLAQDITKPMEAVCKNKCHPDFITFTNEEACPEETECSKPIHDPVANALKCSDTTEALVLEHDGKLKESFSGAKCDPVKGWWTDEQGNSQELFTMAGLNFRVKARCEQLCAFNMDKAALNAETEMGLAYDRVKKTLTCNGTDKMLVLTTTTDNVVSKVGVYSDMTCTKEGWKTDEKAKPFKVDIKPIIADETDSDTKKQLDERKKKFTCAINDCMRPLPCDEECVNPDFEKKKYEMSCESPSKLANKNSKLGDISHDSLRCFEGNWKVNENDQTPVIPQLTELKENIADRERFDWVCTASACAACKQEDNDMGTLESTTDANIKGAEFTSGSYTTCSGYKCGTGLQYVIEAKEGSSTKLKYYYNKGDNTIKCTKTSLTGPSTYSSPDKKEDVRLGSKIGCVSQIPCNEYRPLNTDCEGRTDCDSVGLQQRLKNGSISSPQPVKCGTLGQLFYQKNAAEKNGWKVVDELQCTATGDWRVKYLEDKDKPETAKTIDKLPERMSDDVKTHPHFICAKKDPNPEAKAPESDPETETCAFCPYPPVLDCKDGCKNAQEHATATNNGKGKCEMKIVNGRFKINGEDEIDKGTVLSCQMIDGKYHWMTPDGKKIDSLAVIMKDTDNISTGAIAGIVIGVILGLGLIVFAMVYVAIRKRKEAERQERLKSKGLEQKIDSIIDHATIVDDTKTLVL